MLRFGFQAYGRTPAPADAVPAFGRGSPLPGGKCNDSAIFFLRSFGGSEDRTPSWARKTELSYTDQI